MWGWTTGLRLWLQNDSDDRPENWEILGSNPLEKGDQDNAMHGYLMMIASLGRNRESMSKGTTKQDDVVSTTWPPAPPLKSPVVSPPSAAASDQQASSRSQPPTQQPQPLHPIHATSSETLVSTEPSQIVLIN